MEDQVKQYNKVVVSNLISLSGAVLDTILGNEASDTLDGELLTGSTLNGLIAAHVTNKLEIKLNVA